MFTSIKERLESTRRSLKEFFSGERRWSSLGILLALLVALPVMVWGFTTMRFETRKRAATSEVTPTPVLTPQPTPTLGPWQVRVRASNSTRPIEWEGKGIITLSLDNDSRNNIDLIQLFMTYDPRIIDFTGSDVELMMGGQATIKEVYRSGSMKQLRLIYSVSYNLGGGSITNIHYIPKKAGTTELVFSTDLKTGTLENKVMSVKSSADNLIIEIINGSVTITKAEPTKEPHPTKPPKR